jgi:hypothetical protein
MKVKLITLATDKRHPGLKQLKRSLDRFGWDYEFLDGKYVAFGSKMVRAYEYAKQTDCTHLFIVDAYDVFVLGTMAEAVNKIADTGCVLFNSEKAAWPYSEWAVEYPETSSRWKYLNGGAAFVDVKRFIQMFEENPIEHKDNDQVNLARIYLDKRDQYNMKLDTNCEVFQSIAFKADDDFTIEKNRIINNITGSFPTIIHGNGKTKMDWVYKLVE